MDRLWFYTQGHSTDKKGPVPEAEIRALIAGGQIQPTDLLWTEGMGNWAALSTLPDLARAHSPSPLSSPASAAPTAPVAQAPISSAGIGLPDGLLGWMTFMGVMNIVSGVFACFGCIWMITGIPMIIAGVALIAAKNALANATIDPSLDLFFNKLKSFMMLSGVVYIISFVAAIVILIFYFSAFAAAFASKLGQPTP